MKALNAKFMQRPKSGMLVKDEKMLAPSHYYYRLAHSMVRGKYQKRDQIMSGAWWLDADAFNTIKQRSISSGTHLSEMARHSCAIARRWGGKVDIVVRGLLTGALLGYYGIGTVQSFRRSPEEDNNEKSTPSEIKKRALEDESDLSLWLPARDIVQIYIPGLAENNPHTGNKIFTDAFDHLEQIKIGWEPM
jgi:hypothetical protein